MTTEETGEIEPRSERWERSQQSAHWRDIGISAVAAAARYSTGKTSTADAPAKQTSLSDETPPKVVTLRDIEFFAA